VVFSQVAQLQLAPVCWQMELWRELKIEREMESIIRVTSRSSGFLAAAELIEADLWTQYAELGGVNADSNQQLNPYQSAYAS
jgi:hypothetical protein